LRRFPNLRKIYDIEKTWYGKADILRYMILYVYGGIYIDADCVWINNKSLNNLICKSKETNFFAGLVPNKKYIANGVIGCSKENINILYILNKLKAYTLCEYIDIRKQKEPHIITGPQLINEIRKIHTITVFPSYYFYPIEWFKLTDKKYHITHKINKESYMFHYGISTNKLSF
jgi:mannosyltransferase OCH1-like enzyme